MSSFLIWLAAGLFGLAASPAHALSLVEALDAASRHAPEITAAQAATSAARSASIAAGSLPDPRLSVWVDDLSTSGPDRYRPGSAKRMASVMQEVPSSARREAERRLAEAETRGAEAQARAGRLNVRREAALAWLELYFVDRRLALLDALDAINAQAQRRELAAIGGGANPTVAFATRLEAQALHDTRDEFATARRQAQVRLTRWIGGEVARQSADGDLPVWLAQDQMEEAGIATLPELQAAAMRHEAAGAEVALAKAGKHPDWAIELALGADAMDKGVAMLKFSMALPVFQGSRQDPRIATAIARQQQSEADREIRLADLRRDFDELAAERDTLRRQRRRLADETLPLLQQQVDVALATLAGARGDAGAVLSARRQQLDARMRAIALEAQLAAIGTRLHFLTGEH